MGDTIYKKSENWWTLPVTKKFLGTSWLALLMLFFPGTHVIMVLILDGNSEYIAHAWGKTGLFGEKKSDLTNDFKRSNKKIAPCMRTYLWGVTIEYKYHVCYEYIIFTID